VAQPSQKTISIASAAAGLPTVQIGVTIGRHCQ
jgi:hypothetical protein